MHAVRSSTSLPTSVATNPPSDHSLLPTSVATNPPSDHSLLPTSVARNSLPPSTLSPPTASQTPYTPAWSRQTHPVTVTLFTSAVGPTFDVPESPSSVFLHFWPDNYLQEICAQTNLYAQQVIGASEVRRLGGGECARVE
ncbi:hypothetical protein GBAR_LOCUS17184, partial [Geodia barretti]